MNKLTADTWIPVFMMHGTNDQLVPYGTSPHRFCKAADAGWLMMFGAETIYRRGMELKKPVVLYAYEGSGHEVSNYMFRKFTEMDKFMKKAVSGSSFSPEFILSK
jgi:acetyl esterase/lipase